MIAETIVPIKLDGVTRNMYFNGNTMVAYEEATGKFFLDTLSALYDGFKSIPALAAKMNTALAAGAGAEADVDPFQLLKIVSMRDLRALLWAALHEYDSRGEPHWPLTLSQVGRMLTPASIPGIFAVFLKGQTKNGPTREEMGESVPAAPQMPEAGVSVKIDGGASGIDLPAGVFDSPEQTPEG